MYYDKFRAIVRSEKLSVRDIAKAAGINADRLYRITAFDCDESELLTNAEQLKIYLMYFCEQNIALMISFILRHCPKTMNGFLRKRRNGKQLHIKLLCGNTGVYNEFY